MGVACAGQRTSPLSRLAGSDSEVFTDIEIINNNFGIRIDGRLKRGSV